MDRDADLVVGDGWRSWGGRRWYLWGVGAAAVDAKAAAFAADASVDIWPQKTSSFRALFLKISWPIGRTRSFDVLEVCCAKLFLAGNHFGVSEFWIASVNARVLMLAAYDHRVVASNTHQCQTFSDTQSKASYVDHQSIRSDHHLHSNLTSSSSSSSTFNMTGRE